MQQNPTSEIAILNILDTEGRVRLLRAYIDKITTLAEMTVPDNINSHRTTTQDQETTPGSDN